MVLGSNEVTYVADGSPNTFRVAFKEPIPLNPNVNYLASATIKVSNATFSLTHPRKRPKLSLGIS